VIPANLSSLNCRPAFADPIRTRIILVRGGGAMEFESTRDVMERRYGRLDSGQAALRITGREYRLREILAH
jgi:hypothetical protein